MDKQNLLNILTKAYEESIGNKDYEKYIESLNALKLINLVKYYNSQSNITDENDINIIKFIIKIMQNIYNNSSVLPPISDEEYDKLVEIVESADLLTDDIVGSDNDGHVVNHRYTDLRGTLNKIHFITNEDKGNDNRKSLEGWLKSIENKIGRQLYNYEYEAYIFPKFDGISIVFECDKDGFVLRALTRGNTKLNEAKDVTGIFRGIKFKTIPEWSDEFAIKSEVIMTEESFEKYCKKYGSFKSRRSAVSSIVQPLETDQELLQYITIVPLRSQNYITKEQKIHPDAFSVYPYKTVNLNDMGGLYEKFITIREAMDNLYGVPTDGIVIYLKDENLHKLLGREESINKYEVAYKFPADEAKTILLNVDFSIGLLGNVAPIANVEPVKIHGNTISNISLGSIDRLESLKLNIGDEVIIKYEIIPYLVVDDRCTIKGNTPVEIPTKCPFCGEELIKDPVLKCNNSYCPSREMGKIINYISKMDIQNISEGIVTILYKNGILKSIEDLYRLNEFKTAFVNINGLGSKLFKKIIDGIEKRNTVYDYKLLGSIGIPGVSDKKFKNILNIYYIDKLIEICDNYDIKLLTKIEGIQEKTATRIISGIIQNRELIQFLRERLIVLHEEDNYDLRVVFTGIRDKEFEKFLKKNNIDVLSSYNKTVNIVICDDKESGSSKITKAKKDNKTIMTIDEAYDYFNYH